jgi:hypothetical protein
MVGGGERVCFSFVSANEEADRHDDGTCHYNFSSRFSVDDELTITSESSLEIYCGENWRADAVVWGVVGGCTVDLFYWWFVRGMHDIYMYDCAIAKLTRGEENART